MSQNNYICFYLLCPSHFLSYFFISLSLSQVSNWFANARRRLKNTVRQPDLSWALRIKLYNKYVQGNAERLSVSSDDSCSEGTAPASTSSLFQSSISKLGEVCVQRRIRKAARITARLLKWATALRAQTFTGYLLKTAALHSGNMGFERRGAYSQEGFSKRPGALWEL